MIDVWMQVNYMRSKSGRKKVLFGTNYPMIFPHQAIDGLDDLGLDAAARELFVEGNARRLLGLTAA